MAYQVRDVMKTGVRVVPPEMPLAELEEVLLRERIGGAPVVDDGKLVGIISRSDIVKHLQVAQSQAEAVSAFYLEPFDAEEIRPSDRTRVADAIASRWKDATVADAMSRDIVSVSPDEPIGVAARRMLQRRVHRLLVMDGTEVLGILSSLDLIRLFAEGRVRAAD